MTPLLPPSSSSYPPGDQPNYAEPRGADGVPPFNPGGPESITEGMLTAAVRALLLGAGRVTEAMLTPAVQALLLGNERVTEAMLTAAVRAKLLPPGAGTITEAMLAAAVAAKLNPSAWEAIAPNANLAAVAGAQTWAVRSEQGATVARLRGVMKASAEILAGATIATLPAGFRPLANVVVKRPAPNSGTLGLTIATTGIMTAGTTELVGETIALDDVTFNLT